jgi:hypothetical protein
MTESGVMGILRPATAQPYPRLQTTDRSRTMQAVTPITCSASISRRILASRAAATPFTGVSVGTTAVVGVGAAVGVRVGRGVVV